MNISREYLYLLMQIYPHRASFGEGFSFKKKRKNHSNFYNNFQMMIGFLGECAGLVSFLF